MSMEEYFFILKQVKLGEPTLMKNFMVPFCTVKESSPNVRFPSSLKMKILRLMLAL